MDARRQSSRKLKLPKIKERKRPVVGELPSLFAAPVTRPWPRFRRGSGKHGQSPVLFHWPPPGSSASSGSYQTIPVHRVSKRLLAVVWPGRFRPSPWSLPLKQSSSWVSSTSGSPDRPSAVPSRCGYTLRGHVSDLIASVRSVCVSCPAVLAMPLHRARRAPVRKATLVPLVDSRCDGHARTHRLRRPNLSSKEFLLVPWCSRSGAHCRD